VTADPQPESVVTGAAHHGLHLPEWRIPAAGALASAAVLAGALGGEAWLWAAVVGLQLYVVMSWHRSLDAPAAASGALVGGGLTAIVDVVVATSDSEPGLGPIAVVLGAGYLVAVVQQLVRRDGREHLVDALAATVSLATIASFGAAWLVLWQLADGEDLVVVLAGASVAASVGRLAPGTTGAWVGPLASGAVAGALLGAAVDDTGLGVGLGVAAAAPACLAAAMQARVHGSGRGWLTGAVWPVLVAAPLGYVAVRVLG
jgi:hypothetical protein